MQAMNLFLRDGEVVFHCSGCERDFYVDADRPFVPQLRALSYDHHCWAPDRALGRSLSASPTMRSLPLEL
jgi:hypothetical protein